MGELATEREGMLGVQRACSETDLLRRQVDAPPSSERALWDGDGQCCVYVICLLPFGKAREVGVC